MLYFVILTQKCNLRCTYCGYGEDDDESTPSEVNYTVEDLRKFIMQDPEASIIFYGGEPLLRLPLMQTIMNSIHAKRYMLQTNAFGLENLKTEYLRRFDAILVSIDGRKETTDYYRGNGAYDKITGNLKLARKRGYSGDLIARMTVSERTDIFLDVMHLLELKDPKFDHVHWQLDALWDYPPEVRWRDFKKWMTDSYCPGIVKLARTWGDTIYVEKKVLPIVPFMGVLWTILNDGKVGLRCGSGIGSFAVTTSGVITVCPIAPEWEFAKVGDIFQSRPQDLPGKVVVGTPCTECDTSDICGGRCLFTNKTKLWGETGFGEVCKPTKIMINELAKLKTKIIEMIIEKKASREDFNYPTFNNGLEIIP
ncbi:MAG: TIGR04084 family radical SAM/SPASM domain-containing protein [Candidatus Atabeyarchaeum deiterrae]